MSESVAGRQSPLVGCLDVDTARESNGITLTERSFLTHVNVRANVDDAGVLSALNEVFAVELPSVANRYHTTASRTALWLSPDEWLIIASDDDLPRTQETVIEQSAALVDQHIAITEVSSGQTVIRLSGRDAAAVIARGCPLDLHPSVLPVGHCAQTHINHINVLIWPIASDLVDDTGKTSMVVADGMIGAYDVVVRRSFADHLWRWMQQVQSRLSPPT